MALDLEFNMNDDEFKKSSAEITSDGLRAQRLRELLLAVKEKTYGKFAQERLKLMQMAMGFRPNNAESAEQIAALVVYLKQLEQAAIGDNQSSINGAKYKPLILKEVRWLILLRALTHLHYTCKSLSSIAKTRILNCLGFKGDYEQIQEYRIQCLQNGTNQEIMDINGILNNLREGSAYLEQLQELGKDKKR